MWCPRGTAESGVGEARGALWLAWGVLVDVVEQFLQAVDAHLAVDVLNVRVDCVLGNAQALGDARPAAPDKQKLENFLLPSG